MKAAVANKPVATFPTKQVVLTALRLRKSASAKGAVILTLKKGEVIATGKVSGDWEHVRVTRSGKTYTGWAHKSYLTLRTRKTTAALNLRSSATDAKANVIGVIPKGATVTVIGTSNGKDNGEWRKVRVSLKGKTREGWASSAHLA